MKLAELLGRIFGVYFILYPILFYVWNWFIVQIGHATYQIPDFWVGMAGFLIFNMARNLIFGMRK